MPAFSTTTYYKAGEEVTHDGSTYRTRRGSDRGVVGRPGVDGGRDGQHGRATGDGDWRSSHDDPVGPLLRWPPSGCSDQPPTLWDQPAG